MPNQQRLPREEREMQIIEAFLALVAEIGIEAVTLQKLADAAKVSFATVQAYFGGGTGKLTEGAVRYVGRSAQAFITQELARGLLDAGTEPVASYILGTFEWARRQRAHSAFWIYYYHLCSRGSVYRTANEQILALARGRVRSLLMEAVGKGQIAGPLRDLEKLVVKIHTALVGGILVALSDPAKNAFAVQREGTLETVSDLIRAHGPGTKKPSLESGKAAGSIRGEAFA